MTTKLRHIQIQQMDTKLPTTQTHTGTTEEEVEQIVETLRRRGRGLEGDWKDTYACAQEFLQINFGSTTII